MIDNNHLEDDCKDEKSTLSTTQVATSDTKDDVTNMVRSTVPITRRFLSGIETGVTWPKTRLIDRCMLINMRFDPIHATNLNVSCSLLDNVRFVGGKLDGLTQWSKTSMVNSVFYNTSASNLFRNMTVSNCSWVDYVGHQDEWRDSIVSNSRMTRCRYSSDDPSAAFGFKSINTHWINCTWSDVHVNVLHVDDTSTFTNCTMLGVRATQFSKPTPMWRRMQLKWYFGVDAPLFVPKNLRTA